VCYVFDELCLCIICLSGSQVDHMHCVLVWQILSIWGTGASDRANDAWVAGRSLDIKLYCQL